MPTLDACYRLSGMTVSWANLYRYKTHTESTVYTTPVTCRARPYTGNVVDQTTTVRYLASRCTKQPISRSLTCSPSVVRLGHCCRGLTTDGYYPRV
jgi:hypothetical protein